MISGEHMVIQSSPPMESPVYIAALFTIWLSVGRSEPSCDQTQFLHYNGTCVACPECGPGQQLSEDCGFGDRGTGLCVVCGRGYFSVDTGVAPCIRCTQCILLNRQQRAMCTAINNAQCGHCLPGYYELRSMRGEVELSCVPCNMATVHKRCLRLKHHDSKAQDMAVTVSGGNYKQFTVTKTQSSTISMVLVGSATAASTFLIILMLWTFLLAAERLKQEPKACPGPEGLLSGPPLVLPQTSSSVPAASLKDPAATHPPEPHTQRMPPPPPLFPPPRELMPPSQESEVHPASIVINVTTNIKPSAQPEAGPYGASGPDSSYPTTQQMEQHLQTIWDTAQGQSIELLDYDTVQDLSLLLGPADRRGSTLRRLARSLGVPPQILGHLRGFPDLFHYLRTSTYLLLPQLAQAAALLPCPRVVARIHQAVMNK